jgi:UDP-glucuronate 4-epimerase
MNTKIKEKILVTGCAGFIGMHLCKVLLNDQYKILGIDNLNDYYDVNLKLKRLDILKKNKNFSFKKIDLLDLNSLQKVFDKFRPDKVVNLAAQAGVRYSLENPHTYIESNIMGFMNILECCRKYNLKGLIYASSSSVYGGNTKIPFSENDNVNNPVSIYAVSKLSNELMAHSYNKLFNLPSTGLRFFTVYGPWGRPDMAIYIFIDKILKGEKIRIFNYGDMKRDFTYIDDIISGIKAAIEKNYNLKIYNLGNNKAEKLLDVVDIIEKRIDKKAKIELEPIQLGDVENTFAEINMAREELGFNPSFNISKGINNFIDWFLSYNKYKII